ncbi:MAG TPA: hypothetical protein VFC07_07085 [Verrucomicrobiae bacterium]|nr:hypothetical protein [Verrucomicrobiae bacterium]
MRTPILLLLSVACCIAGCALKPQHAAPPAPPPPVVTAPPEVEPEIIGELPDPNKTLSPADVTELKHRLALLKKGMTREQALEILNLSSFNVRVTSHAGAFGTIYFLEHGHKLLLSLETGTDAVILRWVEFEGDIWPKSTELPVQRSSAGH